MSSLLRPCPQFYWRCDPIGHLCPGGCGYCYCTDLWHQIPKSVTGQESKYVTKAPLISPIILLTVFPIMFCLFIIGTFFWHLLLPMPSSTHPITEMMPCLRKGKKYLFFIYVIIACIGSHVLLNLYSILYYKTLL